MKIDWDVPVEMDDGLQLYLTRALARNLADRLELANTRIGR